METEVALKRIIKSNGNSSIRVDFYLPSHNTVVEVQGIQHTSIQSFGMDKVSAAIAFNHQLNRDAILKEKLQSKGIKLIEIPYNMSRVDIMKVFSEL